eukprot:7153364-Prymnesium_polylepis.2
MHSSFHTGPDTERSGAHKCTHSTQHRRRCVTCVPGRAHGTHRAVWSPIRCDSPRISPVTHPVLRYDSCAEQLQLTAQGSSDVAHRTPVSLVAAHARTRPPAHRLQPLSTRRQCESAIGQSNPSACGAHALSRPRWVPARQSCAAGLSSAAAWAQPSRAQAPDTGTSLRGANPPTPQVGEWRENHGAA